MTTTIVIAGSIGAGKSTLTELLATHLGWTAELEPAGENPYLGDFYIDMQRWAFHSQMFFLAARLSLMAQSKKVNKVQDRCLAEDAEVFAKNLHTAGLISERDWALYRKIYAAAAANFPPPSLIVYLDAPPEHLLSNIKKRGRNFETQVSREYLEQLQKHYDTWLKTQKAAPVLRVPVAGMDFVEKDSDRKKLLSLIETTAKRMALIK
jgi:deoxyadenosine/deoxycytidine kinase